MIKSSMSGIRGKVRPQFIRGQGSSGFRCARTIKPDDDETGCTCGVDKIGYEFVTIRYPNIGNVKLTVDVLEGLVKDLTELPP
jgi:hypothetical protein